MVDVLPDPKMTLEERIATSIRVMALSRMAMIVGGTVALIGVPLGGYLGHRYIGTMDHIAARQEQGLREFAVLQEQLRHTVGDIVLGNKNLVERMEQGERFLTDRQNAQASRIDAQQAELQRLTIEVRDLAKYLYTRAPDRGTR